MSKPIKNAVKYIENKYNINANRRSPTEIPDMGRDDLPELFKELGYEVGLELGVSRGEYSKVLLSGIPKLKLYLVDAWKVYGTYRPYVDQDELDGFIEETKTRLSGYDYEIIRKFSMDAVNDFEDGSLDFIYIDANHKIPWVLDDICAWSPKVKSGGIVSGHDYYKSPRRHGHCHVGWAVDCYVQSFRQSPWFLVGAKAKTPGIKRDKMRSWFWIKE